MKNKTILYLGVASLIAAGSLAYTDSHANNAQYIYRHVHGKAEALKHEKVSIDLNIPKDIYRSENMPSIVARVTNFIESVTWGVSGELPNGVSINPSGVFSGTPTEDGTFRFSLTAKGLEMFSWMKELILLLFISRSVRRMIIMRCYA